MALESTQGQAAQDVRREPGFFGKLFDLSLREFLTPTIASWLFTLNVLWAGLMALFVLVAGARYGFLWFLVATVPSTLFFLVWTLMARLYYETIVVLFRIEGHARELAERSRGR